MPAKLVNRAGKLAGEAAKLVIEAAKLPDALTSEEHSPASEGNAPAKLVIGAARLVIEAARAGCCPNPERIPQGCPSCAQGRSRRARRRTRRSPGTRLYSVLFSGSNLLPLVVKPNDLIFELDTECPPPTEAWAAPLLFVSCCGCVLSVFASASFGV
jgi:hypothetical protein